MYVNPFWFGVFSTITAELLALVGLGLFLSSRGVKK